MPALQEVFVNVPESGQVFPFIFSCNDQFLNMFKCLALCWGTTYDRDREDKIAIFKEQDRQPCASIIRNHCDKQYVLGAMIA